jgi:chaperone modulatory protein CbpM
MKPPLPIRDQSESSQISQSQGFFSKLLARLGINDEGIPVILDLVDQLHGLRRTLRDLLSAIHAQPEAMRRWIVADLRAAVLDRTDGAAQEGPGSDEHQEG